MLKEVDFDVYPGEVHALIGENGAGKSTLVKIISGVHEPSKGEVFVEGTVCTSKRRMTRAPRASR